MSNYLWEVSPDAILSLIFAAAILFLLYLAARGRLHRGHWAEDQLEKKRARTDVPLRRTGRQNCSNLILQDPAAR